MNNSESNAETSLSLRPTGRVWFVVLATVIGTIVVRQIPLAPQVDDMAVKNILSFVLLGIGFCTFLWWLMFRSGYSRLVRFLPIFAIAVAALLFLVFYRLVGVDGSLMPKFTSRFGKRADELLVAEPSSAAEIVVDVTQTTENDFPMFLGPNGNSAIESLSLDPDWESHPPTAEWKRDIGAGWSGFSAVNGFAFTMEQRGENELVTCYRIDDGEPCWSHAVAARHETVFGYLGPRATPTVNNGRVYAMGATGVLRCLDGATGDPVWMRNLFEDYDFSQEDAEDAVAWGRSASPLVRDGVVYIPVGGPVEGKQVSLLAMDAETGETKWEAVGSQASYATPSLLTIGGIDQLVLVNESDVTGYAVVDGEELWSHPWPGKSNMNASVSQPHVVDGDFVFLSKGYGIGAELLELTVSGDNEWDVESLWAAPVLKTKFSNVAIKDGVAYGLDDGILSAVDVETGDRLWKKGRYKYGQILLVGEHLLVMGEDGDLILVAATGDKFNEIAKIPALEGQTWNTICIYGDRVLLRNAEKAACYRLKLK